MPGFADKVMSDINQPSGQPRSKKLWVARKRCLVFATTTRLSQGYSRRPIGTLRTMSTSRLDHILRHIALDTLHESHLATEIYNIQVSPVRHRELLRPCDCQVSVSATNGQLAYN